MRLILTLLLTAVMACPAMAQDDNVAVAPGAQYVLRNVATGSYLMKDGTTTFNEAEASNWRVVTNDTIHYDNAPALYFIHSDESIMQLSNSGAGWSVKFSPTPNTTYLMPSETTPGTFKFRYRYLLDVRFLNVEVDEEGAERLTAAHTSSPYNDWVFVPTSHPRDYSYRLMSIDRADCNTKYCIAYQSVDPLGNPCELSGWIAVPTDGEGGVSNADHVLFSLHHTVIKKTEWPSSGDPMDSFSFDFSTNRPVMIEPDYYGCGITDQFDSPYLAPDIMAEQSVDMLLSSHELLRDLHQMDCSAGTYPTYGIGVSQGASIALACQRYVENSPKLTDAQRQAINWVRSCVCAGAYNPLATFSHYLYNDILGEPSVIPILVMGLVAAFPDIFGDTKAEDFASETFLNAGILELIRNHQYTTDEVSEVIAAACGSTMNGMLSDDAKDPNSDISQKLQKALGQCNITRDWSPRADIVLYYHPGDDVVPYLNTVSFYNGIKDNCQGNIEVRQTSFEFGGHVAACVEFIARMIFGAYKN